MIANNFKAADSLYTLSLKYDTNKFTYYNRSLAKKSLNDNDGFCFDLLRAGQMGDTLYMYQHYKNCGTYTTIPLNSMKQPTFDSAVFNLVVKGSPYEKKYHYRIYDRNGKVVENYAVNDKKDTVRYDVSQYERLPSFPGDDEALQYFLHKNLRYPANARENGIQGVVVIGYTVDEEGKLVDIAAVQPVAGLTEEALRVVKKMPKWNPGTVYGEPVKVYFRLPVTFQLSEH